MKIKKIVLVGAMAALLALGATALAGCGGKSDADVIRESLTQELDQVKNLDDAFLSEVTASAETGGLDQFGIDAKELMKAYFGGFDYRIDDVTVEGDTAKATITLTCKSYQDYVDAITEAALNSEDETAFGENIMEAVNAIQAREADPLELTYQKEGNTWNITSEGQQALYSVLFANSSPIHGNHRLGPARCRAGPSCVSRITERLQNG